MPFPTLIFNSSTGSDTAASGAGPATAISGSAAAHTNGAASTTITLIGSPDLSGVAVDGSAAIWLKTSSGRQFSKITAKDNTAKTVTVEDSFTIALASAVDYAIGGKRATFENADSRKAFADVKEAWIIETETNQTIDTTIDYATVAFTCRGASSVTRPTITISINNKAFSGSAAGQVFSNLNIKCSAGTKTAAVGISASSNGIVYIRDCVIEDVHRGTEGANNNPQWQASGSVFRNCTTSGMSSRTTGRITAINCRFDNCGKGVGEVRSIITVVDCFFDSCSYGIDVDSGAVLVVRGSVFYNCTNDGIRNPTPLVSDYVKNNIFYDVLYGVNFSAATNTDAFEGNYNAFGATTSGQINGASNGADDITLSADPFEDAANGDFNINNAAGGGALLRAATITLLA